MRQEFNGNRREFQFPGLRFTAAAWAKLLYLRGYGETEVSGFGISAKDDLLLVEDIIVVRQICTAIATKFCDFKIADYYAQQVDRGLSPDRFSRILLHTHSTDSPVPNAADESLFAHYFGHGDWSVMCIVARGDRVAVQLKYHALPAIASPLSTYGNLEQLVVWE